jgi:hypothetical protein
MILLPTTMTAIKKLKGQAKDLKKGKILLIRKLLKLLPAKQAMSHGII